MHDDNSLDNPHKTIAIRHLDRALKAEKQVRELEKSVRDYEQTIEDILHSIGKYFSGDLVQKVLPEIYPTEKDAVDGVGDRSDTDRDTDKEL